MQTTEFWSVILDALRIGSGSIVPMSIILTIFVLLLSVYLYFRRDIRRRLGNLTATAAAFVFLLATAGFLAWWFTSSVLAGLSTPKRIYYVGEETTWQDDKQMKIFRVGMFRRIDATYWHEVPLRGDQSYLYAYALEKQLGTTLWLRSTDPGRDIVVEIDMEYRKIYWINPTDHSRNYLFDIIVVL